jgi:hypothetical protein
MPTGLPFVARPPKEGMDAYGRPIPQPVPEGEANMTASLGDTDGFVTLLGFDGWGRPIPGPDGQLPMMRPPGMPFPGMRPFPGMQQMNGSPPREPSPASTPSSDSHTVRPEE